MKRKDSIFYSMIKFQKVSLVIKVKFNKRKQFCFFVWHSFPKYQSLLFPTFNPDFFPKLQFNFKQYKLRLWNLVSLQIPHVGLASDNITDFIQFKNMKFAHSGKLPCAAENLFKLYVRHSNEWKVK